MPRAVSDGGPFFISTFMEECMWVFTSTGFYSIVIDRDNSDRLLVRARVAGDIEALWPKAEVVENKGTDYRFRASIRRNDVEKTIYKAVKAIDYDNFKSAVRDPRRAIDYGKVWSQMSIMQQLLR
jgi:hypothetical protein